MASFSELFPRLSSDTYRITSPASPQYNCIAWSLGITSHWWQPGLCWSPADWPPDDVSLGALERMFASMGYHNCEMHADPEPGFEKVALYALSGFLYTHAARQLPNGMWTSKLGKGIDIEHRSIHDIEGPAYGNVQQIMKRAIS